MMNSPLNPIKIKAAKKKIIAWVMVIILLVLGAAAAYYYLGYLPLPKKNILPLTGNNPGNGNHCKRTEILTQNKQKETLPEPATIPPTMKLMKKNTDNTLPGRGIF